VTQVSGFTRPTVALFVPYLADSLSAPCMADPLSAPHLADTLFVPSVAGTTNEIGVVNEAGVVVTELIQATKADEVVEVESVPTGSDARACLARTEVRRGRA
jgi:hypothetical protein